MSNIKITIDTDNAAFEGGNYEVARILKKYADSISEEGSINPKKLQDINGNTVGEVLVAPDTARFATILSLDIEDVIACLIDYFDYSEDEANEVANNLDKSELENIAWQMAEYFNMDTYWEALYDEIKSVLGIKPKSETDESA